MTLPKPGELVPDFQLPASEGQLVRISTFRGRCNLVLVFGGNLDQEVCLPLLAALTRHQHFLEQENTQALVVTTATAADAARVKEEEAIPFPMLIDEDGRVHRMVGVASGGGTTAMVYVTDRFGELCAIQRAEGALPLPAVREILEWLVFINSQCPECGVPHWHA